MPSGRIFAVAALGMALTAAAVPHAAQSRANNDVAEAAFAAYASGDGTAIERAMTTSGPEFQSDLDAAANRWKRAPDFRHATFMLEVAIASFEYHWPNPAALMGKARDMVTNRHDPPGATADGDAFERTFHKVALAALLGQSQTDALNSYLDAIARRIAPPRVTGVATLGQLVEPRIALVRATSMDAANRFALPAIAERGPSSGIANARIAATMEAFRAAMRDPATVAEALVRSAYLELRVGEPARALNTLRQVPRVDDPVVPYWGGLVLGRVLTALNQSADATLVFEAMARLAPRTQSAPVALAALFLKQGDRDRALEWAERARTTPDEAVDPWWLYWAGDARFVSRWLAELRTLAQLRRNP